MDFVVFGFGLGALILLAGLAIHDLGPRLNQRLDSTRSDSEDLPIASHDDVPSPHDNSALWRPLGRTVMIGGGVIVIVAIVAVIGQLSDRRGTQIVAITAVLVAAIIAIRIGQLTGFVAETGLFSRIPIQKQSWLPKAAVNTDDESSASESFVSFSEHDVIDDRENQESQVAKQVPPSARGPVSILPDLQTLLGESIDDNHPHHDEIITLEQFLGIGATTQHTLDPTDHIPQESDISTDSAVDDQEPAILHPASDSVEAEDSEIAMSQSVNDESTNLDEEPDGLEEGEPTDENQPVAVVEDDTPDEKSPSSPSPATVVRN